MIHWNWSENTKCERETSAIISWCSTTQFQIMDDVFVFCALFVHLLWYPMEEFKGNLYQNGSIQRYAFISNDTYNVWDAAVSNNFNYLRQLSV